jgi:hypothetical protein
MDVTADASTALHAAKERLIFTGYENVEKRGIVFTFSRSACSRVNCVCNYSAGNTPL